MPEENSIDSLFPATEESQETNNEPQGTQEGGETLDLNPPQPTEPSPGPAAGKPAHIPDKFWVKDPSDPTKGTVNTDALIKSYGTAEKALRNLQHRAAELQKKGGGQPAPENVADYLTGYDLEALKTQAPKAFRGDQDNPILQSFFESAQAAGLSVDIARNMVGEFMGRINNAIPDAKPYEQLHKEAVGSLGPNGARMANDVSQYLKARHQREAFSKAELQELQHITASPGGISLLWNLTRQGAPSTPASITSSEAYTDAELDDAMTSDRYKNDRQYRKRIDDYVRVKYSDGGVEDSGTTLGIF